MTVITATGTGSPGKIQDYPSFESQIPALHSFRLTFPAPIDHEIALIQVLVGGPSEDLSPNATDPQPNTLDEGKLWVLFQDADPNDEKFGYRVSHSLLGNLAPRRYQIRDVGCVGKCVRRIALPHDGPIATPQPRYVFALVGFQLFFTGARDHELDRIGIWFRGNDLHVAFRDVNGDDTFGYLVDFIAIPTLLAGFDLFTGIERGTARALDTISLPSPSRGEFLLTGWAFNFKKDDQRILDLGVLRHQNALTVVYGDNGGGEEFDWRVEWAQIIPQVFAPPSSST